MNTTLLPTLTGWSDYEEALAKRDDLTAALGGAYADVERLKREAPAARLADDDAAAQAVLDGTKAPARKAEQKNADDLKEAEARVRVTETALRRQDGTCLALLQDHPERAQEAAQAETAAAGATYLAMLDGLAEARANFHAARVAGAWLASPGRRYKAAASPRLDVPGATTLNGEPLAVEPVLAALAAEVEGSVEMVDGPWRGTRIRRDEVVRMVRRVRTDFTADASGRTFATYAVPASEVERDEAAKVAERAAYERAEQETTRRVMAAQAAAVAPAQGSPADQSDAAAIVGLDPLADLR